MKAIKDYTLQQFMLFLRAAEELDAAERLNFVSDMAVVVGSLFAKDSPIADHMAGLTNAAAGVQQEIDNEGDVLRSA